MKSSSLPRSPNRFTDAVAVVVGGGSGIGAATAQRLAAEGAQVAILDVDQESARQQAAAVPAAVTGYVDVSDPDSVDSALENVVSQFGRIDLLAHVAGVDADMAIKVRLAEHLVRQRAGETGGFEGIVAMSNEEWRRLIGTNLDGVFYTNRAVGRHMVQQRSGSIVNVGSVTGQMPTIATGHYNVAKAGVRMLSQSLALELIGFGVRVNCLAPGPVETPMLARSRQSGFLGRAGNEGKSLGLSIPIGRVAEPAEVAAAIAYLLSDEAAFVVGETFHINGGLGMF